MLMDTYRRLPLTCLSNARELGGFPTPNGATKYGIFIRSEMPHGLPDEDRRFLREYLVTGGIRLSGASFDLSIWPDPFVYRRMDKRY
jgi:protein-tyrosine phosphatase